MKFRPGDMVVVTRKISVGDSEPGTVYIIEHEFRDNWYILVGEELGYSSEQLELESVYNSDLYQALK